jgi:hypothetical protein
MSNLTTKYTVKAYNDFYLDVFIGDFRIMQIDREWPTEKPESERQAHARIRPLIENLNGTWLLGEKRTRRYPENNLVRTFDVTITPDQENENFIPAKKLDVVDGVATVTKL